MTRDSVRAFCLKLPQVTESIQWGDNLVFKIAGKIFAITSLEEGSGSSLAFKCTPEEFAVLVELSDISPAPYLARAHWVSIARFDTLPPGELKKRLRESYDLVFARLSKKAQAELTASSSH
jgi:predicted DNA-binding protein (MmcQ/YjbR family)